MVPDVLKVWMFSVVLHAAVVAAQAPTPGDASTQLSSSSDDPTAATPSLPPSQVPSVYTTPSTTLGVPSFKPKTKRFEISGYVSPSFEAVYRPSAIASEYRYDYGAAGSGGISFSGSPVPRLEFTLFIVLAVTRQSAQTSGDWVEDTPGANASVDMGQGYMAGISLESASATYKPFDFLSFRAGLMRIPLTIPQRSPNTALMFPNRPSPHEAFLSGSDAGAMASTEWLGGRFLASVGAFNGISLGLLGDSATSRGLVFAGRVDVNPLGRFGFAEGDMDRGPFRIGAGLGVLYRPATQFDAKGFESLQLRDFRYVASVRMAFRGLYVQAEYLRRQRTDSFTSRPRSASGAYAQTSLFLPWGSQFAISPIARAGYVIEDELMDARSTVWFEGGLSFFPFMNSEDPNAVRITASYSGERRLIERETAHKMNTQLQIAF